MGGISLKQMSIPNRLKDLFLNEFDTQNTIREDELNNFLEKNNK